jgi:hypothetical protein
MDFKSKNEDDDGDFSEEESKNEEWILNTLQTIVWKWFH